MLNRIFRHNRGAVMASDNTTILIEPTVLVTEDGFFAQLEALTADLLKGAVEFNHLSPTGQQAAMALADEGRATIKTSEGRPLVIGRTPNPFRQLITAGFSS